MILAHGPYPCHPMVLTPTLPTPLFTPMGHGYAGGGAGWGPDWPHISFTPNKQKLKAWFRHNLIYTLLHVLKTFYSYPAETLGFVQVIRKNMHNLIYMLFHVLKAKYSFMYRVKHNYKSCSSNTHISYTLII